MLFKRLLETLQSAPARNPFRSTVKSFVSFASSSVNSVAYATVILSFSVSTYGIDTVPRILYFSASLNNGDLSFATSMIFFAIVVGITAPLAVLVMFASTRFLMMFAKVRISISSTGSFFSGVFTGGKRVLDCSIASRVASMSSTSFFKPANFCCSSVVRVLFSTLVALSVIACICSTIWSLFSLSSFSFICFSPLTL